MRKLMSIIAAAAVMSTSTSLAANAATYTPEYGDCWSIVAENYNMSMDELLAMNNATVDTMMYNGVPIIVPDSPYTYGPIQYSPVTSTTKIYPNLGEGWYMVAERTGYSVSALQAANPNFDYPVYGLPLNTPTTTANSYAVPVLTTKTETFIGSHTLYNVPWGNSWYNIKLSASELNGMTVKAWHYFSFYEFFPHHCGAEGGYLWAGAYNSEGGAFGGGICFTSTTLWQLAVEVLDMQGWVRHDHVRPVDYAIWKVNDAAVNLDVDLTNRQDMQFFNNLGYDVKFYTQTDDNTGALTISAYRVS